MEKRSRRMAELPPDILFDVLKLLPFKSLCRLRCVSRMWRSVIDDPRFLAAQYACSIPPSKVLLLVSPGSDGHDIDLEAYSVEHPQHLDDCAQTSTRHGMAVWSRYRDYMHQQPSDGLYCVDVRGRILIWNAITSEFFTLNTLARPYGRFLRRKPVREKRKVLTVGFDPVQKKHKILCVWRDDTTGLITRNEVFDAEENCYRSARNDLPLGAMIRGESIKHIACIDGFIFYSLHSYNTGLRYLVAFHVGSERLHTVAVPEEAREADPVLMAEFDGHAALAYHDDQVDGSKINLWILGDVENQVWRHRTITIPWREDCDRKLIRLQAAMPAGELLLAPITHLKEEEPFFFFIYNIERNVLRRIEVQGLPKPTRTSISLRAVRTHPPLRFPVDSHLRPCELD